MREVIVLCEGQTEREFCKALIASHLFKRGVALSGRLPGEPQRRRGGIRSWQSYEWDLVSLAKQRSHWHVALLVDFYGMPDDWPGRRAAEALPPSQRGVAVESALVAAVRDSMGERFHPCVQVHEFESLLFVDPAATASCVAAAAANKAPTLERRLREVASAAGSVEAINDSPETCPSRRLEQAWPGYDKVFHGVTATRAVGLPRLRQGCPWLDRWLTRLESLGRP